MFKGCLPVQFDVISQVFRVTVLATWFAYMMIFAEASTQKKKKSFQTWIGKVPTVAFYIDMQHLTLLRLSSGW